MPETTQPDPSAPNPNPEPNPEEAYWAKLSGVLDTWFDKKVKDMREQTGTGTSRTGGRTTLPRILADFMFGPEK